MKAGLALFGVSHFLQCGTSLKGSAVTWPLVHRCCGEGPPDGSPERTWGRDSGERVSLLDQQEWTWLSSTAAGEPGPCPESCSRPTGADAEVWLRVRSGPIRCRKDVWPPCLHRGPGLPSCPSSLTGTCIGSRSRSRTGSGAPPPPTGSDGWNRSARSGTARWAAARSAGSWEGSWTCPVKNYYQNNSNH